MEIKFKSFEDKTALQTALLYAQHSTHEIAKMRAAANDCANDVCIICKADGAENAEWNKMYYAMQSRRFSDRGHLIN
jgi:hypothetical protein